MLCESWQNYDHAGLTITLYLLLHLLEVAGTVTVGMNSYFPQLLQNCRFPKSLGVRPVSLFKNYIQTSYCWMMLCCFLKPPYSFLLPSPASVACYQLCCY